MKTMWERIEAVYVAALGAAMLKPETDADAGKYAAVKAVFAWLKENNLPLQSSAVTSAVVRFFKTNGYAQFGYGVRDGVVIRDNGRFSVEFYPDFPERCRTVSVYKPDTAFGRRTLAEVNFPSYGATTPADIRQFAGVLNAAADLADEINAAAAKEVR